MNPALKHEITNRSDTESTKRQWFHQSFVAECPERKLLTLVNLRGRVLQDLPGRAGMIELVLSGLCRVLIGGFLIMLSGIPIVLFIPGKVDGRYLLIAAQ